MLNKRIISTILFFAASIFYGQDYNPLVYKGNKNYENKKYDAAASNYLEAIRENPNDFTAHYNLGNALYKQGMYKEAEAEYQKATQLSKNSEDKITSLYNQGNALMKQEKYEEAAQHYKKALKMQPMDSDLRKNYEIALLKKDEENKNQNQNNKDKNKNQQEKQQNQNRQNQQNQNQQPQNQQQSPNEDKEKDKNKPQEKRNLTKEQEEQILKRIQDKEKNTSRRILNQSSDRFPFGNEKDW